MRMSLMPRNYLRTVLGVCSRGYWGDPSLGVLPCNVANDSKNHIFMKTEEFFSKTLQVVDLVQHNFNLEMELNALIC